MREVGKKTRLSYRTPADGKKRERRNGGRKKNHTFPTFFSSPKEKKRFLVGHIKAGVARTILQRIHRCRRQTRDCRRRFLPPPPHQPSSNPAPFPLLPPLPSPLSDNRSSIRYRIRCFAGRAFFCSSPPPSPQRRLFNLPLPPLSPPSLCPIFQAG